MQVCFLLKIVSLHWLACFAVYNDNPVMLKDSKSKSSNYYDDFAPVGIILSLVRVDGGNGEMIVYFPYIVFKLQESVWTYLLVKITVYFLQSAFAQK